MSAPENAVMAPAPSDKPAEHTDSASAAEGELFIPRRVVPEC
jgi:hypothetical protein